MAVRQDEAVRREDKAGAAAPRLLRNSLIASSLSLSQLMNFYINNRRADFLGRSNDGARVRVHQVLALFRISYVSYRSLPVFSAESFAR